MDLVVARYSEPLAWLYDVPPIWDIHVYNMGESVDIPRRHGTTMTRLLNRGRESFAYLTHILGLWEKLDEFTVFAQGNPFDHAADVTDGIAQPNFVNRLAQLHELVVAGYKTGDIPDYVPIGRQRTCTPDETLPRLAYRYPTSPRMAYFQNSSGQPIAPMRQIWKYVTGHDDIPCLLKWTWGSQFMARKGMILKQPKAMYQRMVELIEHDPSPERSPFETCAYERLWPSLMGVR